MTLGRLRIELALRRRLRRRNRGKLALDAERAFFRAVLALGPGDVAIDCGANCGDYAGHLARSGAMVHCFEPDPVAFAALSARIGNRPEVSLFPAAVGASQGRATLHRRPDFDADPLRMTIGSSLFASGDGEAIDVDVVDLAAFIAELPKRPAILKIDIEGAEVEVLESLDTKGLLHGIGLVVVETHEWLYPTLAVRTMALVDRMRDRPYPNVNLDWG